MFSTSTPKKNTAPPFPSINICPIRQVTDRCTQTPSIKSHLTMSERDIFDTENIYKCKQYRVSF